MQENEALGMTKFGRATYRLQVKLPKQGNYVFHIPAISSSYELYVNGKCIASCGKLDRDGCKAQNQWNPVNALYYADTETLELVVYTCNYDLPVSGIIQSIIIGTYDHVTKDTFIQITRSAIFMGLLFGFGLYLILVYKKRTNTACLYVGLFCLSCMVLEGFIGSYINCFFFPSITYVTCTLEHELSILASFIEIENYRFNNKIHFETDVDEEYLSITIPQLMLQPIVENAIKHGFVNRDLTIRVSCQKIDHMLCITVHDDGKGMGKGYAASLLTSESKGVGLKNVAARLQKYYQTSIEISSTLGTGTDIRLYIPI